MHDDTLERASTDQKRFWFVLLFVFLVEINAISLALRYRFSTICMKCRDRVILDFFSLLLRRFQQASTLHRLSSHVQTRVLGLPNEVPAHSTVHGRVNR
jgi:hypothetical protein